MMRSQAGGIAETLYSAKRHIRDIDPAKIFSKFSQIDLKI